MKSQLRINFTNWYPGFNKKNNYFTPLLENKYDLIYDDRTPQLVIFSQYGHEPRPKSYNFTKKIYYSVEPIVYGSLDALIHYKAHFITSDLLNENKNHYYYPYYYEVGYYSTGRLNSSHLNVPDWTTKKDISFVYSNPNPKHRNNYYDVFSEYFKINSGGKHLNNIGHTVDDKIDFQKQHAYDLSIENSFEYGYTTEKLLQPIVAQTIPIYWGFIPKHINPARYIQAAPDPHETIRYVKYLNNNPHIAQEIIQQPALLNPTVFIEERNKLAEWIYNIIEN